jgi:Tol biopolymer transport system component
VADHVTGAAGQVRLPDDFYDDIHAFASRTRQRPDWLALIKEPPMRIDSRVGVGSPIARVAIILATTLLMAALGVGALIAGAQSPDVSLPTPGNGRIAFVYQEDIYTVAADGTDRQLLVEGAGRANVVAWSPDGTRLAYWSGLESAGGWQLMVVDADGTDPILVASGDLASGPTDFPTPAWSPDGKKLAFTARTVGGPQTACADSSNVDPSFCSSRVFVAPVDADTSTGAVQVGDPDMSARAAAWSPDGTTVAFSSGDAQKGIGLYLMQADGTDVRRLGEVSGTGWSFMQLAWSPDGKSIAATAGLETPDPHSDIWVFASDGTAEKMPFGLLGGPSDLSPAYAPDGALAWSGGLLEPGDTPRPLAPFWSPVWSPDGQFMVTKSDAPGDLVIVDRDLKIVSTIEDAGDWSSWQRLPE